MSFHVFTIKPTVRFVYIGVSCADTDFPLWHRCAVPLDVAQLGEVLAFRRMLVPTCRSNRKFLQIFVECRLPLVGRNSDDGPSYSTSPKIALRITRCLLHISGHVVYIV